MKGKFLFFVVVMVCLLAFQVHPAEAIMMFDLELHNPAGGPPSSAEPAAVKSQFIMRNLSTAGEEIASVDWLFTPGVYVDSSSAAPGIGGYNAGSVQSSDDVGFSGTSLSDGDTSILFSFTGFDSSEVFEFWTDIDADAQGRVGNSDFNGSSTVVTFGDGTEIAYDWVLPNNNGRSFYALGVTGGDGGDPEDPPPGNNAIPEPATMLLFGAGLLGGVFTRRKKQ